MQFVSGSCHLVFLCNEVCFSRTGAALRVKNKLIGLAQMLFKWAFFHGQHRTDLVAPCTALVGTAALLGLCSFFVLIKQLRLLVLRQPECWLSHFSSVCFVSRNLLEYNI